MEQWAAECRTKTEPGRLKFTTHHGPSRTKCACTSSHCNPCTNRLVAGKTLEGFDVVITTFQTLASEFGVWETKGQKRLDDESDEEVPAGRKKAPKKKATMSALFDVKWLRIVVGELRITAIRWYN